MAFANELFQDANSFIETYGEQIRFRFFTVTATSGNVYDDDFSLAKSGNDTWVSGLVHPIGNSEVQLVQQGLLNQDDLKVYVDGGVNLSGLWKLGIGGSPPAKEYSLAEKNVVDSPQVNGSVIYQKMFVRQLTTGSIANE